MRDWLNEEEHCLSTEDLWAIRGSQTLSFPDLKKWLEEKDREAEVKKLDQNGKRKASDSPKKKNCDRDQLVVQRKHKKVKQARNSEEEEEEEDSE